MVTQQRPLVGQIGAPGVCIENLDQLVLDSKKRGRCELVDPCPVDHVLPYAPKTRQICRAKVLCKRVGQRLVQGNVGLLDSTNTKCPVGGNVVFARMRVIDKNDVSVVKKSIRIE